MVDGAREVLDDATGEQDDRGDDGEPAAGSARCRARGRPRSCRAAGRSCAARPRISATATASPTAADTKFCTVRPTVWTSGVAPASPAYDCQLVLVTNETAVLMAVVDAHAAGALAQRQRASARR